MGGEGKAGSRFLVLARPVKAKVFDGDWRVSVWFKKVTLAAVQACNAAFGDPPVQLSAQAFVNGRTHRCTLEAALRVDSRLQGRFLDSSTTSVNCNGRERRLLVYTCTGTGCKYRIQLESSLSPEEWCCTVLRPFHTCVPTAGEISPDLQKSMDYFPPIRFHLPLSPPPTPTTVRSTDSRVASSMTSPASGPKHEDHPDVHVLDDGPEQGGLDFDCIVAGDPFRSPTPEYDSKLYTPVEPTRRSRAAAQAAARRQPSQHSRNAAYPRLQSTPADAPLKDEISALKAQLAHLEQRLEAKTRSEQAAKQSSKVKATRIKARGLKGNLKVGNGVRVGYDGVFRIKRPRK
ncbi:hypothetical protein JCM10049v2_004460 [Rhodotorula toruloides]